MQDCRPGVISAYAQGNKAGAEAGLADGGNGIQLRPVSVLPVSARQGCDEVRHNCPTAGAERKVLRRYLQEGLNGRSVGLARTMTLIGARAPAGKGAGIRPGKKRGIAFPRGTPTFLERVPQRSRLRPNRAAKRSSQTMSLVLHSRSDHTGAVNSCKQNRRMQVGVVEGWLRDRPAGAGRKTARGPCGDGVRVSRTSSLIRPRGPGWVRGGRLVVRA
jgi:hypothetical protein